MNKTTMLAALLLPMSALAADGGMPMKDISGHGMANQDMHMQEGMKPGAFMKQKQIDGYTVSFHVMKAASGMEEAMGNMTHGGSSNLMVKVEKGDAVQQLVAVNSKVVAPDGKAASKMMMRMGDWYMAGYELDESGRYQLMVLFKTPDGDKHFGGVYYTR